MLLSIASCTARGPEPIVSQTIGADGGSIVAPDGTRIDVPAGAVSNDTVFTIAPTDNAPASSVGVAYTFGPEGLAFAVPVQVTLSLDPAKVPASATVYDLKVMTAPKGSDQFVPLPSAPGDDQHLVATTMHFSDFGVAQTTSSAPIDCAAYDKPAFPSCHEYCGGCASQDKGASLLNLASDLATFVGAIATGFGSSWNSQAINGEIQQGLSNVIGFQADLVGCYTSVLAFGSTLKGGVAGVQRACSDGTGSSCAVAVGNLLAGSVCSTAGTVGSCLGTVPTPALAAIAPPVGPFLVGAQRVASIVGLVCSGGDVVNQAFNTLYACPAYRDYCAQEINNAQPIAQPVDQGGFFTLDCCIGKKNGATWSGAYGGSQFCEDMNGAFGYAFLSKSTIDGPDANLSCALYTCGSDGWDANTLHLYINGAPSLDVKPDSPPPSSGCQGDGGVYPLPNKMTIARWGHAAALLNNGKVLIVGGAGSSGPAFASAELYDPSTSMFTKTGSMANPRVPGFTAARLSSGKVLVVGGQQGAGPTAEVYDPATGSFTATKEPPAFIDFMGTETVLPSGKVFVTSGACGTVDPGELYDPASNGFTATGLYNPATNSYSGPIPKSFYAAAALLPSGRVLLVGNACASTSQSIAEIYDPATNTFSDAGLAIADAQTATVLGSGQVFIAGPNDAQLYDPATGTFTAPEATSYSHLKGETAILLGSGEVLVAGGGSELELYDPTSGTFSDAGQLSAVRTSETATQLGTGEVLIVGGEYEGPPPDFAYVTLSSADLYRPGM
jgi:hypothetical protein